MTKVLGILLIVLAASFVLAAQAQALAYAPYQQAEVNAVYNRLFCDAPGLYKNLQAKGADNGWRALFARPVDLTRLRGIAETSTNDSCLQPAGISCSEPA